MTDEQRLARIRERYGPERGPVTEPPTTDDVEFLLRLLDEAIERGEHNK